MKERRATKNLLFGPPPLIQLHRQLEILRARATKEQASAPDGSPRYHLHVCPACAMGDRLEYVRCTNPYHSFQLFGFCERHAKEEAKRLKAVPPVERDVRILLAWCADLDVSPADVLVGAIGRRETEIAYVKRENALHEYARRRAAGERGFTHKLAKKYGVTPGSLKVEAHRRKKKPSR